jgi:heme/copper-type cytochrome/quinol oxidase subunit 4
MHFVIVDLQFRNITIVCIEDWLANAKHHNTRDFKNNLCASRRIIIITIITIATTIATTTTTTTTIITIIIIIIIVIVIIILPLR